MTHETLRESKIIKRIYHHCTGELKGYIVSIDGVLWRCIKGKLEGHKAYKYRNTFITPYTTTLNGNNGY